MLSHLVLAAALVPAALGFKDTHPVVAWSSHRSVSTLWFGIVGALKADQLWSYAPSFVVVARPHSTRSPRRSRVCRVSMRCSTTSSKTRASAITTPSSSSTSQGYVLFPLLPFVITSHHAYNHTAIPFTAPCLRPPNASSLIPAHSFALQRKVRRAAPVRPALLCARPHRHRRAPRRSLWLQLDLIHTEPCCFGVC
jgi:hypothetical protein